MHIMKTPTKKYNMLTTLAHTERIHSPIFKSHDLYTMSKNNVHIHTKAHYLYYMFCLNA